MYIYKFIVNLNSYLNGPFSEPITGSSIFVVFTVSSILLITIV